MPFYKEGCLLAIEDRSRRRGRREQFALIIPFRDLIIHQWENKSFYMADERWETVFTRETIGIYTRTFFHFVRGKLGQFQIVDSEARVADISWKEDASEEARRSVEERIKELKVEAFTSGDRAHLSATVIFKNALFFTKIATSLRVQAGVEPGEAGAVITPGQHVLYEEELVLENLPIDIPMRSAIWGCGADLRHALLFCRCADD